MTESIARKLDASGRPLISFEFFPPKDDIGQAKVRAAIERLETLNPDFVSVTYGASGSTRDRTFSLTRHISEQTSFATMGHLTCVSQSRADLVAALNEYQDAGVKHVLAVRGDPEGGPTAPWRAHRDGLNTATELVRLVKANGDFCVGVAAFPDAHPERRDFDLDARILLEKEAAGAEFAITQLFFDPDSYFRLVERVRAVGCSLPIIAGIMPVTNVSQIERFAQLCGADLPAFVVEPLRAVADNPIRVREIGLEIAVALCRRLIAGGAPGLQFFTQNQAKATIEIVRQLQTD